MGFSHEFVFACMITLFTAGLPTRWVGDNTRSEKTTKGEKLRKGTVGLWVCTDKKNQDLFLFSANHIFRRKNCRNETYLGGKIGMKHH